MTKKQKRDRHIELSWKIIEWKLMYYYPERVSPEFHEILTVSDETYDEAEKEYLQLCADLSLPNTVVHKVGEGMMEVDFSRPSVQLVLRKYGADRQ